MPQPNGYNHRTPAEQCQDQCFGPEGPGGKVKAQVDKWSGGLALGAWVVGVSLAALAIVVSLGIAMLPGSIDTKIEAAFARRFGPAPAQVTAHRSLIPSAIAQEGKAQ